MVAVRKHGHEHVQASENQPPMNRPIPGIVLACLGLAAMVAILALAWLIRLIRS